MARLGRRQHFKPTINGLSRYIQANRPVASKPLVISRTAVDAAARLARTPRLIVSGYPPNVFLNTTRIIVPFTIGWNESETNVRARRFFQDVSQIINNLLRTGDLTGGKIRAMRLGYAADNLADWGGSAPSVVKDALDILAARSSGTITQADIDAVVASLGSAAFTSSAAYDPAGAAAAAQAASQPADADLTTWASLTPSANAQSLVTAANYAAMRALLDLEAGTDFYSISAADTLLALKAPLASPSLTGTPTAPTPTAGDNTTLLATTAFVTAAVNTAILGLESKTPCRLATTANLAGTYLAGVLTNSGALAALSVDGVSAASGDRVLLKNQPTGSQNGIYSVTTVGSGAVAWVLTRSSDADATGELTEGNYTIIEEGTANAGTLWILTTSGTITIGTTSQTWTQLNITSVALANITGLGTSVATALAVNVGSAGAVVVLNGAGGTPLSLTLTNATGLPIGGGTTGTLGSDRGGTGVANNAASTITISGNFGTTFTVTATTSLTLPASGLVSTFGENRKLAFLGI